MTNCKNCEFAKKCEDPLIGDFYCTYDTRDTEIYRWMHMAIISCPREKSSEKISKPIPIPVQKPQIKKPFIPEVPNFSIEKPIDISSIENKELRDAAEKLQKMQTELIDRIREDKRNKEITSFLDTEFGQSENINDKFLNGSLILNNLVAYHDFVAWNKKNGKKQNQLFIGYLLGKYGKY